MMELISLVIGDAGDGSNFIEWVKDPIVLDRMEQLADEGDEVYASGDGLQVTVFKFKDAEALADFERLNNISYTTLEDMDNDL